MTRRVVVEPEAEADLVAAVEWYEGQASGLGAELLLEVRARYERIAEGEHGTPVPGTKAAVRRVPLARFPLWIVFIERDDHAVVVAHAHERRRPGHWMRRGP